MGVARTPSNRWVEEGLRTLAHGGPDAVRIEVLAKALGVTKGGFYGYFSDRNALLEAMLETWERRSVDEVLERVRRDGGDAREKIQLAGALTLSPELLPIDLAIRDWARRDRAVAERLRRVDNQRMQLLREMIGTYYPDPVEVEARSLLAFCMRIGASFLAVDRADGADHAEVLARTVDIVLGRPEDDQKR
ncbi:TetR/AcrR family transcriptional regulator [Nocardia cyriacigeorgica]|uniref:TetR/AcrR family transcriptional regulator n=1 Tax=Nocardia cyriacigeorgica TaxID=135487 RepID=A0A6P1D845_9NOCA|nr:TetR/AcrR family transcriptional regulator [Nocardia cyriacigeorgica]NEW39879.1 TetR/AcrR family transcriptional regulator [Nocardia cyriacigeorgica]NEW45701.1 TetR/AcrR family transcriptional regulator [Nocardia cyriacigeorgica]NEW51364.1 TetR/AcrR family transcriptional regulator [Nocardia cyriacigeorgica]NEW55417.1 TetR/AcrR family transcriptional regulator [Nocardia cyriacigeorgica]